MSKELEQKIQELGDIGALTKLLEKLATYQEDNSSQFTNNIPLSELSNLSVSEAREGAQELVSILDWYLDEEDSLSILSIPKPQPRLEEGLSKGDAVLVGFQGLSYRELLNSILGIKQKPIVVIGADGAISDIVSKKNFYNPRSNSIPYWVLQVLINHCDKTELSGKGIISEVKKHKSDIKGLTQTAISRVVSDINKAFVKASNFEHHIILGLTGYRINTEDFQINFK